MILLLSLEVAAMFKFFWEDVENLFELFLWIYGILFIIGSIIWLLS